MKNRLYTYVVYLIGMIGFASCSDDSFSDSPSNLLTFQSDTLSLDTVFSTVPSPHKQLMVYNNSGDGLRIETVKLELGNQTGFRVNVNGTYLSPELGYQTTDMELRKGDSLRVFVEITSLHQNDTLPRKVEDNLVFTLQSGVKQRINLKAWSWDAILLKDITVSSDSTIANDHGMPVVVYDKIVVDTTATLTVAPGTTMYFHHNAGLDVRGRLVMKGNMDNEITMRSDRLDRMVSNLMYDNNPGQWGGIRLAGSSVGNVIEYVDIHSGTTAIQCDSSYDNTKETVVIRNSTIHNMSGYGVDAVNANIKIENSQISNANSGCLSFVGGTIDINQCTVAQYYPFDAMRGPAILFTHSNDTIFYPLAMKVKNSIVKGYADDVITWIYGKINPDTAMNVRFEDCLLRTVMPEDKDSVMFTKSILENVTDTMTSAVNSFVLFDTENFFYDFTPKPTMQAVGAANPETALPVDRKGKERSKTKPDMGCYEIDKAEEQ